MVCVTSWECQALGFEGTDRGSRPSDLLLVRSWKHADMKGVVEVVPRVPNRRVCVYV